MTISPNVHILTAADLDEIEQRAFQRGVERGKFEERLARGKERVAATCYHWSNGVCHHCGSQKEYEQVSAEFKCPHWAPRTS